ncbi:unnamed protein product [Musa acuminata subsp. malaccensis]|uniref:(wild Malaysian banana) hypothetical protein n=1 Tax=Musa acuminata subsp. malaccensis TaxID=214687 RepID=A0A8D7FJG1_MUSAM|nr:unnamed protein product [Musa acuminata subsp. malaccensis]
MLANMKLDMHERNKLVEQTILQQRTSRHVEISSKWRTAAAQNEKEESGRSVPGSR